MDWKTVSDKIVQDDQNKWDQIALAEKLEVAEVGEEIYPFSEHAMSQFCAKLDIPIRYFRRLPDEMKIIVANYDLRRLKGTSFLVRRKGQLDTGVSLFGVCSLQQFRDRGDGAEFARQWHSYNEVFCIGRNAHIFENHFRRDLGS